MNYNWLILLASGIFVGWVLYRAFEAHQFRKLLDTLSGELTDQQVVAFMERFAVRAVPNARNFWDQLKAIEARVVASSGVSEKVKTEFRTLLQSKGVQF